MCVASAHRLYNCNTVLVLILHHHTARFPSRRSTAAILVMIHEGTRHASCTLYEVEGLRGANTFNLRSPIQILKAIRVTSSAGGNTVAGLAKTQFFFSWHACADGRRTQTTWDPCFAMGPETPALGRADGTPFRARGASACTVPENPDQMEAMEEREGVMHPRPRRTVPMIFGGRS